MKPVAAVLALVGALFLIAGLVLGFGSVNRGGVNCGSGLGGVNSNGATADLQAAMQADATGQQLGSLSATSDACASAVSDRSTLAWVALGPGIALLAASLVTVTVAATRTPVAA
jgi:uncharacterized membrane protein